MSFLDVLFPKRCLGCGSFGEYICTNCLNSLSVVEYQKCPMCEGRSVSGKTHARCVRPLGLDGIVAGFRHIGLMRKLLSKYKFSGVFDLLGDLNEALVTFGSIEVLSSLSDPIVVPVPLHKTRLRERGFNQAKLLSEAISSYFDWEHKEVLQRERKTKQQSRLKKEDRKENVLNAFKILDKESVSKQDVVLIDDVWTTGSTMRECGKVLKRSGAKRVWGLVLAL